MTCDGISGGFSDYAKNIAKSDNFNGTTVGYTQDDKDEKGTGGFLASGYTEGFFKHGTLPFTTNTEPSNNLA